MSQTTQKLSDPFLTLLDRIAARDSTIDPDDMAKLYGMLRRIANRLLGGAIPRHDLEATALVHEAYLRLFPKQPRTWEDRSHFFKVAAAAMRTTLVDDARRRSARKRTSQGVRIDLDDLVARRSDSLDEVLDVEAALDRLETHDEQAARIAELAWFDGRTNREIARLFGRSERTVCRALERARHHVRAALGSEMGSAA